MAQRPAFIDLRMDSSTSVNTAASRPLRSPRLHIAGEVPPTLSPLDAFVQQSRNLQKQLEEAKEGNRMSRLPPLTTESPLIVQARSDYFRSFSHDSAEEHNSAISSDHGGFGIQTEVESPSERPRSMHPRMSRIPPTPDESIPVPPNPFLELARGRPLGTLDEADGMYGARREQSPSDLEGEPGDRTTKDISPIAPRFPASPEKLLTKTISHESSGLVPPRPQFPKRSSSIMSAPPESVSEEALGGLGHSQPNRKMSTSSAFASQPPTSPFTHFQRSSSISSDISGLPRPSFNFSRPLSRSGTPVMDGPSRFDAPSRQASSDSQPSFVLADETAHTPVSMHSEAFLEQHGDEGSPHMHPRYNLPRGKSLQRNSALFQDVEPSSGASDQTMDSPARTQPFARSGQAPPSPPTRPSTSSSRYEDGSMNGSSLLGRPAGERSKLSNEMSADDGAQSSSLRRPSTSNGRASEEAPRGRTLTSATHDQTRGRTPASVATNDSASTIKASMTSHGQPLPAADISAEEHREKGIKCHEEGSVKESTYHLRLAARGGDPTGMLLYALACRHGWGMRPNQREGVEWLRKAADIASAEIADNEDQVAKGGKAIDVQGSKARKAQFALSIYELGVSHMNGWGIEQDKALALRCFEIAGNWGDVDALTEAGFCYAKGVGCKKDLKKSAKFYRLAEAKGVIMPGNSWIHKDKYTDDSASIKSRTRSKSKSRGIWGKKSKDAPA